MLEDFKGPWFTKSFDKRRAKLTMPEQRALAYTRLFKAIVKESTKAGLFDPQHPFPSNACILKYLCVILSILCFLFPSTLP